ncbi:zinc finger BED domain-containing protein RICESLEEPER 2-like protein [Tanacetum coccineum]
MILTSSEYERYLSSDFISHLRPDEFAGFDVLGFWKAKESMYPILSRMARDMLSVQATSVAFESAFSTNFEEDILEVEVQDNEAIPLSDEEIALDEADSKAMSNGSGSGGEDVDLTLSESD